MDLDDLSDQDRLILGLRFRLKHVRLAIAQAQTGAVPEGFEFSAGENTDTMLAELRRLEAEVQGMLRDHGADASGRLN
ncbi:MAG: hypothetical protein J0L81_13355 [Caulobacterales bacterium]|nr:hypothetical protein [Caulobacterales bacterium]